MLAWKWMQNDDDDDDESAILIHVYIYRRFIHKLATIFTFEQKG